MNILTKNFLILCCSMMFAILFFYHPLTGYAQTTTTTIIEEDNYIITIEISKETPKYRSNTVTGHKTTVYSDKNGNTLWTYTIYGTFSCNGKTSSCLTSSDSYNISDSSWKVKTHSTSKSGNTSTGTITMNKTSLSMTLKTITQTVTLSCSADGTLY